MSVYIEQAGEILEIPSQDDRDPDELCGGDCRTCLTSRGSHCPARMRLYEMLADAWMLQELWPARRAAAQTHRALGGRRPDGEAVG
jgi:hypothetical protein